ncbi:uncharacterized protein PRCAT00003721001 [Priceomyces carsonii]|uniref:uncharacterized protein n=1 Tax=Priceomyces carsonii TaxID=28549 RepID=UPI002ED7F470|nr:unnamed protein product [Priceomyces carsonii]
MTLGTNESGNVGGWNDCPTPMLSSSGSVKLSRRRNQRVNHIFGDISSNESNSSLSSPSDGLKHPNSSKVLHSPVTGRSNVDLQIHKDIELNSNIDVHERIQRLFELPSLLASNILDAHRKKLQSTDETILRKYATFIDGIVTEADLISRGESTTSVRKLRQKIVDFMILNDGVSSWSLPLKNVIESLDVNFS